MADIELIVKIDADVYTRLFDNGIQDNEIATDDICEMARALRLGKPLTESDDCVSREAVNILVDELARAISDERCCMSRGRSTATIMQDILDLPSVQPKSIIINGDMSANNTKEMLLQRGNKE